MFDSGDRLGIRNSLIGTFIYLFYCIRDALYLSEYRAEFSGDAVMLLQLLLLSVPVPVPRVSSLHDGPYRMMD